MSSKSIAASSLGLALRSLAQQEVRDLLAALANTRSRHRGVHEARKAIRRLRSLLWLGRANFGGDGKDLDQELKALATSLSALRDAHVVVDTAGGIARGHRGEKASKRWASLRRRLSAGRKRVLDRAMSDDPGFEQRRANIAHHAQGIERLPWDTLDADTLTKELTRSLRRMRKAEGRATQHHADDEQRHRWRRRLRRMRMQWNALKTLQKHATDANVRADTHALLAWLRTQAPHFDDVSKSADALGAEQDLILLQTALEALPHSHALALALQEVAALQKQKQWHV